MLLQSGGPPFSAFFFLLFVRLNVAEKPSAEPLC